MDSLSKCLEPPPALGGATSASAVLTTALATVAVLTLTRYALWPGSKPKVIRSPLTTLIPRLSAAEREALVYRTDYYPGARDVPTPVSSPSATFWHPPLDVAGLTLCSFFSCHI